MYAYPRRRFPLAAALFFLLPALLLVGGGSFQILREPPPLLPGTEFPASSQFGSATKPDLPAAGSVTAAVTGLGTIGGNGPSTPRPIASVTKMMTAYVVLKGHPLRAGESGPTLTLTDADARRFLQMILNDESALPVQAGLRLTQLQLLQGMLIASAGNFAEILAAWDAGSISTFVAKMNAEAKALGMSNTTYADVGGISNASVSTPEDILILARRLMSDPVFASIVGTRQTQLPGAGTIRSTNDLLGQDGVIGIKTGFTEVAGGTLAFAAQRPLAGQDVQVLGVVLGQADRPAAFSMARRVLDSVYKNLQLAPVISPGQKVATLNPAWGSAVDVVAGEEVRLLVWPGMTLEATVELGEVEAPLKAGDRVGSLTLRLGEQERRILLLVAADVPKPDIVWRLTRF